MFSLFLRILNFSAKRVEFSAILDLNVVSNELAYLREAVISSLLEGVLVQTASCLLYILSLLL